MIMNTKVTFEFEPSGAGDYDPVTHTHKTASESIVRTVNATTVSGSRAYQDYGTTDLRLMRIRSLDVLPSGFARAVIDGVTYSQYDRQQIGTITTITLQEVLPNG